MRVFKLNEAERESWDPQRPGQCKSNRLDLMAAQGRQQEGSFGSWNTASWPRIRAWKAQAGGQGVIWGWRR